MSDESQPRRRRIPRFYLAVAVLSVLFAVLGLGSVWHFFASLFMVVGAAVVVLGSLVAFVGQSEDGSSKLFALRYSAAILAGSVLSLALGLTISKASLTHAKRWCERQVPAIEQFKREHGAYPKALDDVPGVESLPWLDTPEYRTFAGERDGFAFDIPRFLTSGDWWGSDRRVWVHYR